MNESSSSGEADGWEGALRRLGESSDPTERPVAPSAGSSTRNAGVESSSNGSPTGGRLPGVASGVALFFRAFATVIWVGAFVGAVARGQWAFAVLAVILGSLSGFWLSQGIADHRSRSK